DTLTLIRKKAKEKLDNPNFSIKSLIEDSTNRMWLGTDDGLLVYNRAQKVFKKINDESNNVIIRTFLLSDKSLNELTNSPKKETNSSFFRLRVDSLSSICRKSNN